MRSSCSPALCLALLFLCSVPAWGQLLDVERALRDKNLGALSRLLDSGEYEQAARYAVAVIDDGKADPGWHHLLMKALVAVGDEERALLAGDHALLVHPGELSILAAQQRIAARIGNKKAEQAALDALNVQAKGKPTAERSAVELVALGQAALALGADPQRVLKQYLEPAKKKDMKLAEAYLSIGELALSKGDYARAAEELRAGMRAAGESADFRAALARAFAPSDRAASLGHLEKALEQNARHESALLQKAEHELWAEQYTAASTTLDALAQTNARCPELWAYRSVVATLSANDESRAQECRETGLKAWAENPVVDYLIGKCLSKAYRFTEGAQHQQRALELAPGYALAKMQLCHDLMRLGHTEEAWQLAAKIRENDAYQTQAHNLGLLEREMSGYHVERTPDFILRLPVRDWQVYGPRALELLTLAKQKLAAKYGWRSEKPVLVEFLPTQQDFAIRTFGSLGGQGLLGVCFGTVITMNSPGSLAAGRSNWESTLWHEFTHVVTLSVTRNRMPRWLSEGLSVYEERCQDPAWGMRMNEEFRQMILEKNAATPLGEMSSAFLNAKDGDAIMLAYLQSSMAVEWMVQMYGMEKLRKVMSQLAEGKRINAALEDCMAPLPEMEGKFKTWFLAKAEAYGKAADWGKLAAEPEEQLKESPHHLAALRAKAVQMLEEKQWDAASDYARRVVKLLPDACGIESGEWLLARAERGRGNEAAEADVLRTLTERNAEALPLLQRLQELDEKAERWVQLRQTAGRAFSLQPFLPAASQGLALAAVKQALPKEAVPHYQRLLTLGVAQPAVVHYELARLQAEEQPAVAKRHLLDALALAPRYQKALQLLAEWPGVKQGLK